MSLARIALISAAAAAAVACSSSNNTPPPGQTGAGGTNAGGAGGVGGAGGSGGFSGPSSSMPNSLNSLFPPNNWDCACPDLSLAVAFDGPPTLGTAGKIQIFDVDQPATPVQSLDMAAPTVTDSMGGTTFGMPRTAYIDGNAAIFYLHPHGLAYGKNYYINVDPGVVIGPDGVSLAISDQTTWHFTTMAAGPASLASLRVALEGTGDFCSVQGALDALPANNADPVTITIAPGTYREIVHFRAKNNVTLHGMDRKATIIAATNNNTLNPGTAIRSLVGVDASSGVTVENLTIHNLTPQNGSQAEALRMQGCDKCIVRDADILSLQDTLLWSGRVYASNCYVEGNVDFVWGTGVAYFDSCEIKTVGRAGYDVQSRNGPTGFGYVFVDSRLTSDPGLTNNVLARIDVSVYPGSHVAYINCQLGSHISPAGWLVTGGTPTSALRFWEYQSVDPAGNPIDVSQRLAGSTQLTADQAAMMRDPTMVLGGWDPTAVSPSAP